MQLLEKYKGNTAKKTTADTAKEQRRKHMARRGASDSAKRRANRDEAQPRSQEEWKSIKPRPGRSVDQLERGDVLKSMAEFNGISLADLVACWNEKGQEMQEIKNRKDGSQSSDWDKAKEPRENGKEGNPWGLLMFKVKKHFEKLGHKFKPQGKKVYVPKGKTIRLTIDKEKTSATPYKSKFKPFPTKKAKPVDKTSESFEDKVNAIIDNLKSNV